MLVGATLLQHYEFVTLEWWCHHVGSLLPPCIIIRDETFLGNSMPVESDYKLPVGFLGKW